MEKQERSKIGLSFIIGIIGAYFLSKSLTNMAYSFGLDELTSATNARYLMSLLSGIITGAIVVIIPNESKFRALAFVVGSLLLMDTVAYFGTAMPISDMINRMLVTIALSISGLITFLVFKFLIKPIEKSAT
ncbi:MAG: hypothetical protein ACPGGA_02370 [Balneolaceae bacterium]